MVPTVKFLSKKKLSDSKCNYGSSRKTRNPLNPEVKSKLKELKNLLKRQDSACWEIGDLCIELIDCYYLSLKQIGIATNYTKARISHFHLTSRTFKPEEREGYTFQDSLTARQIYLRMPRLNMSVLEIRDKLTNLPDRTPRSSRSFFVKLLLEKEINQSLARSVKTGLEGGSLINNCHNADFRTVVPKLPDNSVKLFIADPPFGGYEKQSDGSYKSYKTSGMRNDCDFGSTEEALSVTLALFEICKSKLAKDGVLLLFQPGGKPDRVEILQKAAELGWECSYALTWFKGNLIVGNHNSPYNVCSEKILVFIRKGDKIRKNENGLPLADVLNFPTETTYSSMKMDAGKMEYGDYHIFQKPSALVDFLIKTHTYAGDLVVEPFGCSGSGIMSAIKNSRKWVYIESNQKNFAWGAGRIHKLISDLSVQAG